MRVWHLLAVVVMGVAASGVALAQVPSLTLIPPPADRLETFATSISADGRFVSGFSRSSGETTGFTWTREGGRNDFGSLPGVPANTQALGLSANGSVVIGTSGVVGGQPPAEAFRFTGGMYQNLGAPPPGNNNTSAFGVSGDASVIVGSTSPTGGFTRPMRWTQATGMQEVALPRASNLGGWFTGVSRDGSTAIGIAGPGQGGSVFDAYTWTQGGGWRALPIPSGLGADSNAQTTSVNFNGSLVVGYVSPAFGRSVGLIWRDGEAFDLGTFGPRWNILPSGVSDDGSVITGSAFNVDTRRNVAALWLEGGSPIYLEDYLISLGVTIPSGWHLAGCGDISMDGRTFVGLAQNGSQFQGFVATIPSPSVLAAVVLGTLMISRRRQNLET